MSSPLFDPTIRLDPLPPEDEARCFSTFLPLRCQGFSNREHALSAIPLLLLVPLLVFLGWTTYRVPRATLLLATIEVALLLAVGGWDLGYRLDPPGSEAFRVADLALAISSALPTLLHLLTLLALFLSDLRPHLPPTLKGRIANVLLACLAAPLVPLGLAGALLGSIVLVQHRRGREGVFLDFASAQDEWTNVVLSSIGVIASTAFIVLVLLTLLLPLTHRPTSHGLLSQHPSLAPLLPIAGGTLLSALHVGTALIPLPALPVRSALAVVLARRVALLVSRAALAWGMRWFYVALERNGTRRPEADLDAVWERAAGFGLGPGPGLGSGAGGAGLKRGLSIGAPVEGTFRRLTVDTSAYGSAGSHSGGRAGLRVPDQDEIRPVGYEEHGQREGKVRLRENSHTHAPPALSIRSSVFFPFATPRSPASGAVSPILRPPRVYSASPAGRVANRTKSRGMGGQSSDTTGTDAKARALAMSAAEYERARWRASNVPVGAGVGVGVDVDADVKDGMGREKELAGGEVTLGVPGGAYGRSARVESGTLPGMSSSSSSGTGPATPTPLGSGGGGGGGAGTGLPSSPCPVRPPRVFAPYHPLSTAIGSREGGGDHARNASTSTGATFDTASDPLYKHHAAYAYGADADADADAGRMPTMMPLRSAEMRVGKAQTRRAPSGLKSLKVGIEMAEAAVLSDNVSGKWVEEVASRESAHTRVDSGEGARALGRGHGHGHGHVRGHSHARDSHARDSLVLRYQHSNTEGVRRSTSTSTSTVRTSGGGAGAGASRRAQMDGLHAVLDGLELDGYTHLAHGHAHGHGHTHTLAGYAFPSPPPPIPTRNAGAGMPVRAAHGSGGGALYPPAPTPAPAAFYTNGPAERSAQSVLTSRSSMSVSGSAGRALRAAKRETDPDIAVDPLRYAHAYAVPVPVPSAPPVARAGSWRFVEHAEDEKDLVRRKRETTATTFSTSTYDGGYGNGNGDGGGDKRGLFYATPMGSPVSAGPSPDKEWYGGESPGMRGKGGVGRDDADEFGVGAADDEDGDEYLLGTPMSASPVEPVVHAHAHAGQGWTSSPSAWTGTKVQGKVPGSMGRTVSLTSASSDDAHVLARLSVPVGVTNASVRVTIPVPAQKVGPGLGVHASLARLRRDTGLPIDAARLSVPSVYSTGASGQGDDDGDGSGDADPTLGAGLAKHSQSTRGVSMASTSTSTLTVRSNRGEYGRYAYAYDSARESSVLEPRSYAYAYGGGGDGMGAAAAEGEAGTGTGWAGAGGKVRGSGVSAGDTAWWAGAGR